MSTLFAVCVKQLRDRHNPHPDYVDMVKSTFEKLYAKEGDKVVTANLPSGYGSIIRSGFLDSSIDELIILPIDVYDPSLVDRIRSFAQENNLSLMGKIIPPASGTDYYQIDPELVYINFTAIRSLDNIDWGDRFDTGSADHNIHLNNPVLEQGAYVYSSTNLAQGIVADDGWILFNRILGVGGRIGQLPDTIVPLRVNYFDGLLQKITEVGSSSLEDILDNTQKEYFAITKQVTLAKWQAELESNTVFETTINTHFKTPSVMVENCYMESDYDFTGLQMFKTLNRDSNSRLVFIHTDSDYENNIKNILENWTGTNTDQVVTDPAIIESLDNFYTQYTPAEFTEFWTYCKSIYHMHFQINHLEFLNDIESQCHVNNFIWAGHLGSHPFMLRASKLKLAASEFVYLSSDNRFAVVKVGPRYYSKNVYKQFRMTFRNTQTGAQQAVRYNLEPHLLAQKWARANQYDYLEQECLAEKNYMLQHWEYTPGNPNARDIPALCAELNRYVEIINNYFDGSSDRRVDYHITQYFDPATLDQNILNEIHHHFEILIGQVWNVSEYFKKADLPTSFAIRQLNNLCHEMESLRKPGLSMSHKNWTSYIYFPFIPGYRYKFVESDYDHFERNRHFGDLFLHYAQLGKTPLEAWFGRDEVVGEDNITGLRYLSGEFVVNFTDDISDEDQTRNRMKEDAKFFPWLRSKGQDPESKFTGVGNITIGKFERNDFPGMTAREIMLELFKYDDIYKLELIDYNNNVVAEKILDYTWKDVLDETDPTRNGQ